jgi:hypothetical protein
MEQRMSKYGDFRMEMGNGDEASRPVPEGD